LSTEEGLLSRLTDGPAVVLAERCFCLVPWLSCKEVLCGFL